ncbi:Wadjet anti-phage system protein JetD domain-containing protein [Isoptericola croceus]|uniref:Wadjet anti-phage system protein JetD domain-containing protein n=1 Tax=Isoptericola croceus TaxID=3031406 RepID=UPI0023F6287D|nr:Wadjet anti-phage system protein JetD domain-containing protein [Isoptericola croceus]
MSARLVSPDEARALVARSVGRHWLTAVCGERVSFGVASLRPGVSGSATVLDDMGLETWAEWLGDWDGAERSLPAGVRLRRTALTIAKVAYAAPRALEVDDLDAALRWCGPVPGVDVSRASEQLAALRNVAAAVTPSALRRVLGLPSADADVVAEAVRWFSAQADLSHLTARQVPAVPHTKWLDRHGGALAAVLGWDPRDRLARRPAVAHLTYLDPDYLAAGGRRHDSWTAGDEHELPYSPRVVVVVENRDSRLGFLPVRDAVAVEGGGRAANVLLGDVPWVSGAEAVVYWGDLDTYGFEILHAFRAALATRGTPVRSILMDVDTLHRYADRGTAVDPKGKPLQPTRRRLDDLAEPEDAAYREIAAPGDTSVRRIEQEYLPLREARERLLELLSPGLREM